MSHEPRHPLVEWKPLLLGGAMALALACGGGGHSTSQSGPAWTGAQVLENNLLFDSRDPSVAVDGSGNALVAWQRDSGGIYDVWAKPLSGSTGWRPEGTIESFLGNATSAKVAVSESGTFMVTWDQDVNYGASNAIYVRRWNPGTDMDEVLRVNDYNAFSFYPTIALDATGGACIAWMESNVTTGFQEIKSAVYSLAAGEWSVPRLISTTTTEHAVWPVVAMDPAGNAVVLWAQTADPANGPFSLQAARLVAGLGWSAPMPVGAGAGGVDPIYSLAMNAGGAMAAWSETTDGGQSYQVFSSRWTQASEQMESPVRVSAASVDAWYPSIGVDAQGNAQLAWAQGGEILDLMVSSFSPATGWSANAQHLGNAVDVGLVKLSVNASGGAALVWQRWGDSRWNIDGALYSPATGWNSASHLENDNAGNTYAPDVHIGTRGQAVAVWYQLDANGVRHIIANRAQ